MDPGAKPDQRGQYEDAMQIVKVPQVSNQVYEILQTVIGGTQMGAWVVSQVNDKEHLAEADIWLSYAIPAARATLQATVLYNVGSAKVPLSSINWETIYKSFSINQDALMSIATYGCLNTMIDCAANFNKVIHALASTRRTNTYYTRPGAPVNPNIRPK
jgi:hypothetical protein